MSTENGKLVLSSNPTDMLQEARDFLQRVQQSLQESTDFDEILGIRDRGELFRQVVRDLIMKVSPPPYLELFGRRTVPNWCVWGDAIERVEFAK